MIDRLSTIDQILELTSGDKPRAKYLSARGLAGLSPEGVDRLSVSRTTATNAAVRELREARLRALGNTQVSPDDLETPRPVALTPHRSSDSAGFRDAVRRARGGGGLSPDLYPARDAAWEALQRRLAARPEPEDSSVKERAYRLRDWSRTAHPLERAAKCGHTRIGEVALMRSAETGTHSIGGVAVCGSVWSCPVCAMQIKARRAEEVKEAVALVRAHWSERSCLMATMTTSHSAADRLKDLRVGYQQAWNAFMQTVPLEIQLLNRARRRKGLARLSWKEDLLGYVGGAEVTVSYANGWHYHRHVILAFSADKNAEEIAWLRAVLGQHWKAQVRRYMGEKHCPSDEHGLDLKPLQIEKYISKLGLEISDVGSKSARYLSRSIWDLQASATSGHGKDFDLYSEFVASMTGAKAVVFSRGLLRALKRFGFHTENEELTDEPGAHLIYELTREEWRYLRSTPGAVLQFLSAADEGILPIPSQSCEGWGSSERSLQYWIEEQQRLEREAIREESNVVGETRADRAAAARLRDQKYRREKYERAKFA